MAYRFAWVGGRIAVRVLIQGRWYMEPVGLPSLTYVDLTRGLRRWKAPAYLSRRVGFDFAAQRCI